MRSKKLSGGKRKYSSFNNRHARVYNKNAKSNNVSNMKKVKLPKNPSFAAKLAAFMLEGVHDEIFISKTGGFSGKHHQVFGVLPFLHMNITEKQFMDLINSNHGVLGSNLTKLCNKKSLNKSLKKVKFNCQKQSNSGIVALNMAIIDSINNRYNMRKNGKRRTEEILSIQHWQHHNNNEQIPKKSLDWGK